MKTDDEKLRDISNKRRTLSDRYITRLIGDDEYVEDLDILNREAFEIVNAKLINKLNYGTAKRNISIRTC